MSNKQPLSARYPDLLAGQSGPALNELIEDLETLYTSHTLPARLVRPGEISMPIDAEPAPIPLPVQSGTLASSKPRRPRRWARLNALAAVLFTVLLVGALVATFGLARRQAGLASRNGSASLCRGTKAPSQPLVDLRMMTATTGWAITWRMNGKDTFQLARTIDGGCHWKVVAPDNRSSLFAGHYAYISATAAWIELVDGKNVRFARTTDGGASWQYGPASGSHDLFSSIGSTNVTFLTPDIGWALSEEGQGTKRTGVTLYHTVNGGLSWQKLMQSSVTPSPAGTLPATAFYTGLSFLNQSTGWATANSASSSGTEFYVTRDGGRTWQKQNLPLPQGISSFGAGTIVEPPQFFSARDGVLPVLSWSPSGLYVYVTRDGGASWQSTTFLRVAVKPGLDAYGPVPTPRFASQDFGWLWEGAQFRTPQTLVVTHDGGQHWTSTRVTLPAPYIDAVVDFLSERVGWLIGISGTSTAIPPLFKTEDGGKTWTRMNYSIA